MNQRDERFDNFIEIGNKKDKAAQTIFENYSGGLKTQRDAWCYNSSKDELSKNIQSTIDFYNSEVDQFNFEKNNFKKILDSTKISWSDSLSTKLGN